MPPSPRRKSVKGPSPPPKARGLQTQYKVVELSTVDEVTLEEAINEWVAQGWNLDGIQFAMRESSKRPSMAFVLFTRESPSSVESKAVVPFPGSRKSAWERLRELAEDDRSSLLRGSHE